MAHGLSWSEKYSVGHDGLDAEHRALIAAITGICTRGPDDDLSVLHPLIEDVRKIAAQHFESESAILRAIIASAASEIYSPTFLKSMTDAVLHEHVEHHASEIIQLDSIFATGQSSASQLCYELENWFLKHAVKYDAHLKALFQAMQDDCPKLFQQLS